MRLTAWVGGQRRRSLLVAMCLLVAVAVTGGAASTAGAEPTQISKALPTVVLEHGAFADASGWNAVVAGLQGAGYTVYAPANPLRGLAADSDYLRTFLATISGPIVLVGHSYGGAVITNAAAGNKQVKALVYIAAYAPAEGETLADAGALGGGTSLLPQHLVVRPYPGAPSGDGDGSIDPAFFRTVFAQDLPASQTRIMAAEQRPVALSALGTPSGVPAWKDIPSWFLVAGDDHAIPPEAERAMAARAHSHTVEISSSHVAMISHPGAVTKLITQAAGS